LNRCLFLMRINLSPQILRAIKMSPRGVVPPSIQNITQFQRLNRATRHQPTQIENPSYRKLGETGGVFTGLKKKGPSRDYSSIYKAPVRQKSRGKLI